MISKILCFAKTYGLPIEVKAGRRLSADSMAKIDELEKKIQLDKQTYEKTINKLKLEEEQLQRKDTYEQRKNEYEDRKFWRKETIEIIGLGLAALGSIATAYALYRKNQS